MLLVNNNLDEDDGDDNEKTMRRRRDWHRLEIVLRVEVRSGDAVGVDERQWSGE